ncbi:MAG: GerAB/ArcD/ProY family transporter [Gemmataceae bacterium]
MNLGWLDISICLGYLALVFMIGLWCSRAQSNNDDYFLGGRRMHWFPIGLSIFAGTFSSLSFVGLPRDAAYEDYHLFLGILFIPVVVMPIVGWYFLPLYHRLGATSPYEYLEQRFNRKIRLLASVLFMLYSIGWMGSLLVAVGKILQVVLDLSATQTIGMLVAVGLFATFYTALGGVKAVVWTDALQAFALGGGMLAVLVLAVAHVEGGFPEVVTIGNQHDKFAMFRMELDFAEGNFFAAVAFGFFVYLAGHAVHFTAVQRYMSMPGLREARWALVVNGVMVAAVCLVFFLVGTTLFAFYQQSSDPIFHQLETEQRGDQLLPYFVLHEMPEYGLTGLLLAGLFAAAMSSMDSGINSSTATVVCDWYAGQDLGVRQSRILTGAFGLAAILVSLVINELGGPIFRKIMAIAGTFLGPLLGIFMLGLLNRRAGPSSVVAGFVAGMTCWAVAKSFGMSDWWDGAVTSTTTLLAGWLVSLAVPAHQPEPDPIQA